MADADSGRYPVNTSELTTSEVGELPVGVFHLLSAEEVVSPGWGSRRGTLCGEHVRLRGAGVTSVEHCPGCECVPRFCPECVQEACQWSAES